MNISQLKDIREAIEAILNDIPVWSLGTDGKWFKLSQNTHLSSNLKPLVIEGKFFEQRKAFAEGKTIEISDIGSNIWMPVTTPSWNTNNEYRIKLIEREKLWFWRIYSEESNAWHITASMFTEENMRNGMKYSQYTKYTKLEALGFEYKEN